MARISEARFTDFKQTQQAIAEQIQGAASFEQAAQQYTTALYTQFRESIVLIRQFATVPYAELPESNKQFVSTLATSQGVRENLHAHTLVLSLVGTSGDKPAWNDRKQSRDHVGIPLISAQFIDAIPMMSRLLKQVGLGLDWINSQDATIAESTLGLMSGLFFVPDAATEVDSQGRKIITAQEFVTTHQVKTVCGFGGGYFGTKTMVVTIIFLREAIKKQQAEFLASAMSRIRTLTGELVKTRIFQ